MLRLLLFLLTLFIYLNSFFIGLFYTSSEIGDLQVQDTPTVVFFGTTPKVNGITNVYFQTRLDTIQEIFSLFPSAKLLISGFHTNNYSEIESMQKAAQNIGIPAKQIITHYADDTFDTLRQLKKMHQNNQDSQIILVSQKFHLERANLLANLLGVPVINIETKAQNLPNKYKLIFREYFARVKVYLDVINFFTRLS